MRAVSLVATTILLAGCSTPEERKHKALMDQIENQVQLPKGAHALGDYARYYTHDENGDVHGVYLIPFNDEPRPGEGCEELGSNLTGRNVSCPPGQSQDALAAGKRRWVDDRRNIPFIMDGGCMEVDVIFDASKGRIKSAYCNGVA